ncbi:MAG: hypothetical protein RL007_1534 [Bacteroidota bacterium]|jgi:cytochrome c5
MRSLLPTILIGAASLIITSCEEAEKVPVTSTEPVVATSQPMNYSVASFVVTDSVGKFLGYGYDIYNGTKKMIHQSTIPGEPGVNGFVSAEEAERVGKLVVHKLENNSGFPTINRSELDSLKITLQ